jgi:hypothetical protein
MWFFVRWKIYFVHLHLREREKKWSAELFQKKMKKNSRAA